MANIVETTVIEGGAQRNLIVLIFLKSDGVSGDLNKQVIVDPADFGGNIRSRFELRRIDYNFAGFDALIEFDSGEVTPTFKWTLSEGANSKVDFDYCGGIKDTSGIDGTGKVMITTSGFNNTGDFGTILLKLRMPG